uniref:Major capsid protein N-terminal domain-containing protein n=1 Tax=viral metagenome TaxID=1070528 RepID=A0A6C0IVG5_9ZZZZ
MGGGLIQLVAYGAQDIYLTGNPQITFFKYVYKRHTNFAIETFRQFGIGTIKWSNKITYTIERKADLLGPCYLEFIIEFIDKNDETIHFINIKNELLKDIDDNNISKSLGYSFIDYIDIEIGGTTIDTQTGHWMAIQNELKNNFNKQINNLFLTNGFYKASHIDNNYIVISIPLNFWFNSNPGMYLPLVALQFHDVKINVKLNPLDKILLSQKKIKMLNIIELNLLCDYIYLDTDERKLFAKSSHEYLIEQIQFLPEVYSSLSNTSMITPIKFNHPVKQIVWTIHQKKNTDKLGKLWSGEQDRIDNVKIQLNGVDRFEDKAGYYFQTIQKYNYLNGINLYKYLSETKSIYKNQFIENDTSLPIASLDPFVYNFCLNDSNNNQPSGSCNFSRLDNAVINFSFNRDIPDKLEEGLNIKIYGVNYNILKIKNGMGGILYSN